ncbi:MAG: FKBP-type peptidylprolyl isomerase [Myxococcales bacterium]|nr:FKBP-type peptidylprolyl isomerase [Myxococcales bacterium]
MPAAPAAPVAPPPPPPRELGDPPPDVAAPPAHAERTPEGVSYLLLEGEDSTGESPTINDRVTVHYQGWTTDGKLFDSSVRRGQPATFQVDGVIEGWQIGLPQMKVGQTMRMWIPVELAYKSRRGAPEGMLVFEIELLDVVRAPQAPADVANAPADATVTASGLAYRVLQTGSGTENADAHDKVKVHYSGWTTDGKLFDSSVSRGRPAEFRLNTLIAGWTEALQFMVVGEKTRLWIPVELAYEGEPNRPEGMLVFDVELLEIIDLPPPPPTPKHVAKAPRRAKRTKSKLRYRLLHRGDGKTRPTATSRVRAHYSGWTTDGKLFDSSLTRGKAATFPLASTIPGWTEGLQLMRVGDQMRFWIPERLAYKGQPGKPAGALVFDVELLAIEEE